MFIPQAQYRKMVHSELFIYDLYTRLMLQNARRVFCKMSISLKDAKDFIT